MNCVHNKNSGKYTKIYGKIKFACNPSVHIHLAQISRSGIAESQSTNILRIVIRMGLKKIKGIHEAVFVYSIPDHL